MKGNKNETVIYHFYYAYCNASTGKEIIPFKYETGYIGFSEEFSAQKLHGKWGFINKEGVEVIPFKYEEACNFSEGLAAVKSK